jgi:hypothetical protein
MDVGAFFRGRHGLWRTTLIAWAAVSAFLLVMTAPWTGFHDMDPDDVMRLVQVRDLLAGQAWFDPDQHRGAPAPGFSMHWSRLPDLGPAALMLLFGAVAPARLAEALAMTLWPLLTLAPALAAVGLIARRLAGARAMAAAMLLFGLGGPAIWQFFPGRIDHHALQMLGVLIMLAGVLHLRREGRAGLAVGAAAGLAGAMGLSVGLEALAFWLITCGLAGLTLVRDGARARPGVLAFGLTTALATPALALALNPGRYVLSQACDQVALPVLGAAAAGGLGLALAAALNPRDWRLRLALCLAAGAAAASGYVLLGPDCLKGPMARVDPSIIPIWMGLVTESQTLPSLLAKADPFGARVAAIALMGLAALAALLSRPRCDRWASAFTGLLLLAAGGLLMMQLRVISYAAAFAGPLIAAALVVLCRRAGVSRRDFGAAMMAGLLATLGAPFVTGLAVKALAPAAEAPAGQASSTKGDCYDLEAYRSLAALPPGLAAAPIDAGPFILASSGLSVLAAPYHRNAPGILAAHGLLSDTPAGARRRAHELGVDYVAVCAMGDVTRLMKFKPDSLAARLQNNEVPAWLAPVKGDGPVRIYRVKDIY